VITRIHGKLLRVGENTATLSCAPFDYEILVPEFARRQLETEVGQEIHLHTVHYLEGNPAQGRLTPRLVGFTSDVEREFFELFCSVDGVGVRKALRAMVRPVREVASAIGNQDAKVLSSLPGVGPATAERVIAKLRRKMAKFALLVDVSQASHTADVEQDVVEEVFQILVHLGHSENDSRKLLDSVLAKETSFKDVDSMLQAVYSSSEKP
tara:strand:+ start:11509 stop:12138 length:630 start_codon:yes stop_codon:yes gene_type:complete